ncbi:hypothetical protein HPB47_027055, partial [Ixodes persulcatus]
RQSPDTPLVLSLDRRVHRRSLRVFSAAMSRSVDIPVNSTTQTRRRVLAPAVVGVQRCSQAREAGERREGGQGAAQTDKDKISVEIDVEGFKADDVTLKAVGRQLNVRAFCEHTEGDTKIRRELRRNVVLPEGVDVEKIACRLTAENKLVIEIPLPVEKSKGVEYVIPVRCEIARSVSKEGEATTTKTVER